MSLTCAGDAVNSRSEVLDDGHGASLDSQESGQLEDHVLGAVPVVELPGQLHTNPLGALEITTRQIKLISRCNAIIPMRYQYDEDIQCPLCSHCIRRCD